MPGQDREVEALQDTGGVQGGDAQEEVGGAGDEHAGLVDCGVGGVEVAEVGEWGGGRGGAGGGGGREEERGGDGLVDGVFGDVDEQEGEHVGEEELLGALEVVVEGGGEEGPGGGGGGGGGGWCDCDWGLIVVVVAAT